MKKAGKIILIVTLVLLLLESGYPQISTESRIREGIQFYMSGDLENAYQIFQSMEDSPPVNKQYFLYYALTLKDLHYQNYGEWIEKGLKLFPNDPQLKLLRVEWFADQGKFEDALRLLNSLQSFLPKERFKEMASYLSYNQGVILYKRGEKKESAQWFYQAYQFNPKEPRFIRNYAIVLFELGEKKKAQQILERYVHRFPTDEEMTKLLIQIYNDTGETQKLGELLEKNAKENGAVEDSLVLAQYYMYTGKLKNAQKLLKKIEMKHPSDKRPYEIQLEYWKKQLHYRKIDSILTVMQKKFPQDTTVLQSKIKNYMEMDSLKAANRELKKLLKRDSLKFIYHAMILKNLEKLDKSAWKKYLEKITNYPFSAEVMEEIAHYWFRFQEFERSLKIYKDLLFIHHESPRLWTDLGIIYSKKGLVDSAKKAFQKAIQFKKDRDYRSYFHMADILIQEGDSLSSRLYFEIGMEFLLEKLGAIQKVLLGRLQQKASAIHETYQTKSIAEDNVLLEKEMYRWMNWFSEHFPSTSFEEFMHQFLTRFPQNKNLRYIFANFYIRQQRFSEAKSMLKDVLYMEPAHIPARKKLIEVLKHTNGKSEKIFSLYREIFRIEPDSLSEQDYQEMIRLARSMNQTRIIAQEWLLAFNQGYREKKFVTHLIEMLHYAGFHEKARKVQQIYTQKKRYEKINPLLEIISTTNSKRALP